MTDIPMSYIVPHINTLIVDIGTKFTKVGYTGDFRAYKVFETKHNDRLKILERCIKESGTDSLIFIDNNNLDKTEILRLIFPNKLCNSILFLKYEIASLFGFGKTTGIVFNCSASNISAAVVLNGRVSERQSEENTISNKLRENRVFLEDENSTASNDMMLLEELNEQDEEIISNCIKNAVEFICKARNKFNISKKNVSTGCIVLSGGMFRFENFHRIVRKILLEKIGEDFNDFILREKELDCVFSGASILGMNNQSKGLFISIFDWKEMGSEIIEKKCW